ncbi:MAG: hypothetical protein AAGB93_01525 [Planctomycetota bacterium]
MAEDDRLPDGLRELAATLRDAYDPPISSHVVTRDGALVRTFVGNTIFDGDSYREFLEAALEEASDAASSADER